MTEVKKDDMGQGIVQCIVQLESVFAGKRQVDEKGQESPGKAFGQDVAR